MRYMLIAILLIGCSASASKKAVTDEGDVVILNSDGTWRYEGNAPTSHVDIATNNTKFKKSDNANFLLKSTKNDVAVWINTKQWNFKKSTSNEDAEYEFQLKGEDLYGMMISEGIEIAPESLTEIALGNAKNLAPNIAIIKREFRNVNGENVIYMEMQGTAQGIDFTYLGYYFSNRQGTTQLVTYTATSLVEKYRKDIDELLNGFATASLEL